MIVYRRFKDLNQATEFAEKLILNGVPTRIVDNSPAVDITFSANHTQEEVQLLIQTEDREKADEILKTEVAEFIQDIPADHYLFQFDNEELYDVLKKYDEWNVPDYQLAQKILSDRGEKLSEGEINELKSNRDAELNKIERAGPIMIMLGYLFSFFGGVGGIFLGIYLIVTKKTLTTGRKIRYYQTTDRVHGLIILILSLAMIILWTWLTIK